ncbi:MBL fold metallo-hydrolase [Solidesulfovibrio alcoholivorans]|uniref:MBL fold metallo-hydrolase n=1 Tax=Solidesulfovibrio alcoholivorans TaxID=81406 RepID=UPI0004982B7F|nr:MBL fold metallo-hydrolase [Solidesulfovibrio alcoholivorans]
MYFKQIQTPGLGCFSYVLGCPAKRVCVVVDPRRDIDCYLEIARDEGMRITGVIETHLHADHVSGGQELRAATGAPIYIHPGAGVDYPHEPLLEGQIIEAGAARMEVLYTPGHTPNSVSLLVSDLVRSPDPAMILTGDVLFVGDIGRPDLAGAAILDEQVQNLYDSLYVKLAKLPPELEVYPAHGQGSLCGRGMSAKGVSTLGYERRANAMLRFADFAAFKKAVLSRLPARPKSFSHIIETNRRGAPLRDSCPLERELSPERFAALMEVPDTVVIDSRDAAAYGGAHIPGSLNIGFEKQLANWVGMSVAPGAKICIVAADRERASAMRLELFRIGYDDILGHLAGGMSAWTLSGRPVASLPQMSVHDLAAALAGKTPPLLLDVRTDAEWEDGHAPQAVHRPFADILERGPDVCLTGPVAVVCGSGYRSNIIGSALAASGCADVRSVAGGMIAWTRAGLPTVTS